jgi:hypothetical protein
MSYYNRRGANYSKVRQLEAERLTRYNEMKARKARWLLVAGPVPLDVWENSEHVNSFDPNAAGVNTLHVVRYANGGYYFQIASGMGWTFQPCTYIGEGAP